MVMFERSSPKGPPEQVCEGTTTLFWVGRAANYAAKLTSLGPAFSTWITEEVHDQMAEQGRLGAVEAFHVGKAPLDRRSNKVTKGSNWTWKID